MPRIRRYLTRMILFLMAVALVAGALSPALAEAFMANPALNGVIIAVLVIGIGYAFRQVLM
ncbi:MAG: flagellar motor protein MotA, partial [Pseudomonadota bacterium]|nr:flagellar motor protein MotA [Pseudomonadota bacterium]